MPDAPVPWLTAGSKVNMLHYYSYISLKYLFASSSSSNRADYTKFPDSLTIFSCWPSLLAGPLDLHQVSAQSWYM